MILAIWRVGTRMRLGHMVPSDGKNLARHHNFTGISQSTSCKWNIQNRNWVDYHKLESSMWERRWDERGWDSLRWGTGIGGVCRCVHCGGLCKWQVFSGVCCSCGKFLVLGLLAGDDGTRCTSGLLQDNLESGWIGDGSWRWRGECSCSVSSSFVILCMSSTSENKDKNHFIRSCSYQRQSTKAPLSP